MVNPHNTASLMFQLPDGVDEREAENIVQIFVTLADEDGNLLLEVEQGWEGSHSRLEAHSA